MKTTTKMVKQSKYVFNDPKRQRFYDKHGEFINDGKTRVRFEDGALEENDFRFAESQRIPPPSDPLERAKLIKTYWEIKVSRAVHAFDNYKLALKGEAFAPAMTQIRTKKDQLNHLKQLQTEAKQAVKMFQQAERELKANTPHTENVKREERARKAESDAAWLEEIDGIKL